MIIRSRWRRAGGLAAHLGRTDTNEVVVVRADLVRDMPAAIGPAVALATAIARTSLRTKRDLIHIKISPAIALAADDLAGVLALVEREHAIPASMPRLVVEHRKGRRPAHVHLVYPLVDPATGRAVRSHENFLHDEIASRLAELALGERVVPGSHQRGVIAELDRRGLGSEADLLAAHPHTMPGDRLGDDTRQHANALGHDAGDIAAVAYADWRASDGDPRAFETACAERGYGLVRGDRAVLLLHRASGAHVPLARALRQKAKEAGEPLAIRERDLREAFADAPSLAEARERGLEDEAEKARAAVAAEFIRFQHEALRDGQHRLAERLERVRKAEKKIAKERFRASLTARRREIRETYARRDRLRRARVGRAFLAAGVLDRRDLRLVVFRLAGAAILLAGGGLGLALLAAGVSVAVLPSRERARAASFRAGLQRAADRDAAALACRQAYDDVAAQQRAERTSGKVDFRAIAKAHRGLAGALCHLVLASSERTLSAEETALAAAIRGALGTQAGHLEDAVRRGAGRGILTVLGWYDPDRSEHRRAIDVTLRPADAGGTSGRQVRRKPKARPDQGHDR